MSSSIPSEPRQPNPTEQLDISESNSPIQETSDAPDSKVSEIQQNRAENKTIEGDLGRSIEGGVAEEGDEEEEGECGFCLFMKGGGCKETFVDWEKCVDEAEKKKDDIVEKCFQATTALKKCMEAHSDYYAPILQAEKAAEAEAAKQVEDEKERLNKQGDGDEELGKKEALGGSDPKE